MIRKSEELLKCGKTLGSASTDSVVFCCGKTAAAALYGVAAAFLLWPSVRIFPPDPLIALAVTVRSQLNID